MKKLVMMILFFVFLNLAQVRASAATICTKAACVEVEVVSKDEDLIRGLQGRDSLKDKGMLFVFPNEDLYRFWMKDMKFAIDMVWINGKHQIVSIAPSRPACLKDPCETYVSSQKALYVLEIPDGFSSKNQLKVGDTLEFKGI